jgi:prevent-host-death family protein
MCYMAEAARREEDGPAQVGVRELRQNLSVYLDRVKAGETLEVTERGNPVAILAPRREHRSVLEQLRAEGKIRPATGSIRDLPPPIKVDDPDHARKMKEALDWTRADKI